MRWGLLVLVALSSFQCGSASEEDDVTERAARCERVRDRLIELRLADATGVDRSAHKAAMQRTLGAEFIDRCASEMTAAQIDCTLGASDVAGAAACSRR
jgi:hypothetical protein